MRARARAFGPHSGPNSSGASSAPSSTRPARAQAAALLSGLGFAIGLGLGGMTQPRKVIAFLDVAGDWDPSLALVMIGALVTHGIYLRRARSRRPAAGAPPAAHPVDRRLLIGAAIFGIGWGVAGYCPGPAVVSIVTCQRASLVFVAAMCAGMGLHAIAFRRPRDRPLEDLRPTRAART